MTSPMTPAPPVSAIPKKRRLYLVAISVVVAVSAIVIYRDYDQKHPSTNDAYLNANVVRLSPQIGGVVSRVLVQDHQQVRKDDLLVEIEPENYQISLQEAEAMLGSTSKEMEAASAVIASNQAAVREREAYYEDAKRGAQRMVQLRAQGMVTEADADSAQAKLRGAKAALDAAQSQLQTAIERRGDLGKNNAQVRAALARVARAKLNLSYTQLKAPADGFVSNVKVRPGATVAPGELLMALVEDSHWWVDANYKETDLSHIKPGQSADVRVDMYPSMTFEGVVASVSPATGAAFSLLPPENATGNWVKVTQRIPVRIDIKSPDRSRPLRIGASAEVTIDTTGTP